MKTKKTHRFIVNGTEVEVDCEDDVRLLWVLRDLLGVTGPKYGCGLSICQSCTSHINGKVFNPCAVPVGDLKPQDHITTIEGLADTFDGAELHPVQQVWIDEDVAQCGFCQPGQIMAAVGLIEEARGTGREIAEEDLDALRNVCRCGTYPRVRKAILKAAEVMAALPPTRSKPRSDGSDERPGAARDHEGDATGVEVAGDATAIAAGSGSAQPLTLDGGALVSESAPSLLGPAVAAAGTAVAVRSLRRRAEDPAPDADRDTHGGGVGST